MFNNSNGGLKILTGNESIWLNILSSSFSYNTNEALMLQLSKRSDHCNIVITNFTRNKGISDGVAMYIYMLNNSIDINISHCKFDSNTGDSKIVYATLYMPVQLLGNTQGKIYASFCSFIHIKIGSTLHLSQMLLKFYDSNLFQSNSARSGIVIYFEQNSQVTIDNNTTLQFITNTASVYGGAIYADVENCYNHGTVFINISNYNSFTFVNNSLVIQYISTYQHHVMW